MKAIFEPRAVTELKKAIEAAGNHYEIGGVLLGNRDKTDFHVVAVTSPKNSENSTGFSFVLDGRSETRRVQRLQSELRTKVDVLGVWHSHVDGNRSFSQQDRASNLIAAKRFDGAISVLVVCDSGDVISFVGNYIDPVGKEQEISVHAY